MKHRKIYDLYASPKGPTCQSVWYARYSKQVWQVAAYSVRQAIFLAARGIWFGDENNVGIVAEKDSDNDAQSWRLWTKQRTANSPYKHGTQFKGTP